MASRARPFSCVYASRLSIPPDDLATLAVFFDEIWLPYPYDVDPEAIGLPGFEDSEGVGLGTFFLHTIREEFRAWKENAAPLFNEGVLRTLPPPVQTSDAWPAHFLHQLHKSGMGEGFGFGTTREELLDGKIRHWDIALGKPALATYAAFSPKPAPELFLESRMVKGRDTGLETSTPRLATFLARSLFQYQIPQLAPLPADEILEVRNLLAQEKEGFVAYLYSLVDDVEKRAREGHDWEDAASLAVVERKVIPEYVQFRRVLESKKSGFWAKVLEAGGKFMQIDASPWTPKFYWGLFEAFSNSIEARTKLEEDARSNAGHAFQYLAKLESKFSG
jgi:hypothetical protein